MAETADPLVSVVVTTHYRNERLQEALESVEAQTHEPVEVIVVDGSRERHAEPVVSDGHTYVAQEDETTDIGPHAGRSVGASRASGGYVQFLDDDDRLLPEKLERQLALLREEDDVGVVYCGIENEFGDVMLPEPATRGDVLEIALRFDLPPCNTSTMLIDTDIVDAIQPLPNRHGADDIGMKIELARRTRFDFVDAPLVLRGEPEERRGHTWDAVEGRREILERYDQLYEDFPPAVRRTALASVHENAGHRHVEEHLWSPEAIVSYYRMLRTAPEPTAKQWGQFVGVLLGRPGFRLLGYLWRLAGRPRGGRTRSAET